MININNFENERLIKYVVKGCLKRFDLNATDTQIEIDFLTKEEIKALNLETRGIDKETDVLSYPTIEIKLPFDKSAYPNDIDPETGAVMLGDICVCLDIAKEQAKEYNHSEEREVAFLISHGVLHLLGYDHVDENDNKMFNLQDEILNELGITREVENFVVPTEAEPPFKCGYVAVLGRPNAGKSTLINALVGEKVSIVSWKPQTTRNKILGIANFEYSQIIFIDTPGLHSPKNELGKFMMKSAGRVLEESDLILYLIDCEKGIDEWDYSNIVKYIGKGKKVIVAVNKVDHVLAGVVASILTKLNEIKEITSVIPISALKNKNVDIVKKELEKELEECPAIFPTDMYTDKNMRFITAEVIREKALRLLDKEVPYGIGVVITKYAQREDKAIIDIDAEILCEKNAHKPIILGKKGDMIKKISTYARQDLEQITGIKIFLTLFVKVKEDWRDSFGILNEIGYNQEMDE